jgi:hypothetical protein
MPTVLSWSIVTRPNTNIPFYELTPEERTHIEQKYINTGLLYSYEEITSEDGLNEQRVFKWYIQSITESEIVHSYIDGDTVLQNIERNASTYNKEHGIKRSNLVWEVRDDDGNILGKDEIPQELIFAKV